MFQAAQNQDAQSNIVHTAYGNYLNDTQSIALMEGRNAYVRALEDGASESAAKTAAREAIADYYVKKQENLIKAWNAEINNAEYLRDTAQSEQSVQSDLVNLSIRVDDTSHHDGHSLDGFGNASVTLVDDSTQNVRSIQWSSSGGGATYSGTADFTSPESSTYKKQAELIGVGIQPPTSDYSYQTIANLKEYRSNWKGIKRQNNATQSELDDFISQTYDEYQAGLINKSDLVDPYLGAREYGPNESFQSWSLMSLSSMGLNSPTNLSEFGEMEVTDRETGITYSGILMSDGNPSGGGFEVNQTYNASNLEGLQFVVTGSQQHEIEGEFVIESMTNSDGETIQNTTYRNVTYQTANIGELETLYDELSELRQEIEDRQQAKRASGGGLLPSGDLFSLGSNIGKIALVSLIALAALLLVAVAP